MKLSRLIKAITLITLAIFLIYIFNTFNLNNVRNDVEKMGIWAPMGIFLLRFTSVILPALPSTSYSLLAGALLGFKNGVLIICISDLLSCSTSFYK